ncbi:transglycosylase domain-containing protein [Planotetraspora phitsanulokensis]|uniref:transglycosylase domain-containing protein n=1 Tax=Planotetraspora phitsanulokensis TaxID=575192 RepID=UPI00194F5D55|nr:transglycosylase domain-containing protein [Planotetraspora phitsanulokensis]
MKRPRKRLLRILLIAVAASAAALVVTVGVVWVLTPIPDTTQELATAQGSVIYYRDGRSVLANEGVNRKNVPLSQVPTVVRNAVIAAENRTFYQDQGVSLSGTARAMWSTLTGGQLQGGSTITQQMVRNYYSGLGQERSIGRKLKEIMIALKVDQSKSKDWVLEQYLNTIYFGRGAYGIQAASLAYFNKDVQNLTPAEGAYLAAVIQQPSRFADPKGADLEAARARWRAVVDGMVATRALTSADGAAQEFPKLAAQKAPLSLGGQNGYMLAQVRAELNRLGYSDENINQGGLKITTTFDKKLMGLAQDSVKAVLPSGTPKSVRTGLAAVDPATGEVVAFYGGRYETNQYDNAFSAKVQAGSTFKPYALAAALQAGYGLGTRVYGNSPLRIDTAEIPNSDNRSYGSAITLVQAAQYSVNTAFVDLGRLVGLDKVAAAAEAAGIPADQLVKQKDFPTFPLGTASVSAVQQASGFATFAAKGVHRPAHVIRAITDANGVTKKITVNGVRAFSEATAADTTYALEQVVTGGTGTAARLYDRPVAGKTGTTDESAAVWFSGYVPQLAVAVDMFRDDNKPVTVPGYGELYGGTLPAQIWKYFMSAAMEGKPVKEFPDPVSWDPYYYWDGYGASASPSQSPSQGATPTPTASDTGAATATTPDPRRSTGSSGPPGNGDVGGGAGDGGIGVPGDDTPPGAGTPGQPPRMVPTAPPGTG